MANINIPDSALFQAGAGPDLKLTHDGTNSTISNATGTLTINNIANSSMILGTNNTTAVTIDNSQNTTFAGDVYVSASGSPSFRVTDTTNTVTGKFQADDTVGKVGTHTNHSFQLFSNNTTALTIDTSQNATFANHVIMADSKELRLGNNADLLLYHNGSNSYLDHYNTGELYIRNRRTSGDILIATRASNGDNVPCVTFNSAGSSTFGGKVSLGTQTDGVNSFTTNRARFGGHATSVTDVLYNAYWNGSAWINDDDSSDSYLLRLQHDVGLLFQVSEAQATPSFATKFSVTNAGDSTIAGRAYTTDGSASYPAYSFSGDSDNGMYKSGTNEIGFATNGVNRITIHDGGEVTVQASASGDGNLRITATSTNDTRLDLQNQGNLKWRIRNKGNESHRIEIRDADENDGVIMAQGATAFSSGSDERLKCNWTSFDNALSDINSLTKVGTFQYKNFGEDEPRNDKVHSGLSAQEVQKFLPSAIDADEEGEKFLYLRYQELIPVLVKGVQELSAKVKVLENG
tara:strand:+ start:158 stop:1711 length:1554 start_codon:yes stop_codon:yes gene_type:complete